jgi:hypothetical protein
VSGRSVLAHISDGLRQLLLLLPPLPLPLFLHLPSLSEVKHMAQIKVSARIRLVVMCGLEQGLALWFADTFLIMPCLPRYRSACRSIRHCLGMRAIAIGITCRPWARTRSWWGQRTLTVSGTSTLIPRHFAFWSQVQGCAFGLDSVLLVLLCNITQVAFRRCKMSAFNLIVDE